MGRASDLVIEGFIRFITMAAIPVVICAGVLYVLVSECVSVLVCVCVCARIVEVNSTYIHIQCTNYLPPPPHTHTHTLIASECGIVQPPSVRSVGSCEHGPQPDLDGPPHRPHLLLPRQSYSSVTCHLQCRRIHQRLLHPCQRNPVGVSDITMM